MSEIVELRKQHSLQTERTVREQGIEFLRKLHARETAKAHATTDPIYIRVSPAGKTAALAAVSFRGIDSVDLHRASDKVHLHRLEPAPGGQDDVRLHDICVLLSNGIRAEDVRKNRAEKLTMATGRKFR